LLSRYNSCQYAIDAIRDYLNGGEHVFDTSNAALLRWQRRMRIALFVSAALLAVAVDLGNTVVRVCSLEALLAMKRASDRPRDRDDLEALEVAHPSEDEPDD
jgi:hypothetical protein